jgi:hypothetical protein
MTQAAYGVQFLHQQLERNVLVRIRLERRVAHALEHFHEGRVATQVMAHHQRVDEEADQRFELLPGSIGDRHPDHHFILAAEPVQERRVGRQQRDEQRRSLPAAERIDRTLSSALGA